LTIQRPIDLPQQPPIAWGSDVAAAMLRAIGTKYVALNPGASYRGFHDSLVNFLGDVEPTMLLCLHEDHAVSIAHGYAKATDEPMGVVLHSNVGLMHGLMGIFNAYCDRMPMIVVGATGPVAPEKRRPWIDWIHTAKDQGALLRDYAKWDDEPRSAEGIVEAFIRGKQLTTSEPKAPVYICLDAGLQEQAVDPDNIVVPPMERYAAAEFPCAPGDTVEEVADLLANAKAPLFLFGRGSRRQVDWDRRVRLAEAVGASVMTSIRERCVFPTDHPLVACSPFYWLNPQAKSVVSKADVIVSFDWVDLNGLLQQVQRRTSRTSAKIVHASLDSNLHRGWSMDYFGVAPVDYPVMANADAFAEQLLSAIERKHGGKAKWTGRPTPTIATPEYATTAGGEIAPRDIEVALAKVRGTRKLTLAHVTIGWAGDAYHFRDPLDFLGHDGGGGLAAGPGITIGAALALKDSGRIVVSVLGDGDLLQGITALWTSARYGIPALFIVSNNRSNFNDEIHQETIAKHRGRPVENRWIGQRIDEPAIDLVKMAEAQGVQGEGPINSIAALETAIVRGLDAVAAGKSYFIDVRVAAGYANPPLARGE